jgi:hypothetical protein
MKFLKIVLWEIKIILKNLKAKKNNVLLLKKKIISSCPKYWIKL